VKAPDNPTVQCRCLSGHALIIPKDNKEIKCESCPQGQYSDGFMQQCKKCPTGHAAIPGFFLDSFTEERIPNVIKQNCSGTHCKVSYYLAV